MRAAIGLGNKRRSNAALGMRMFGYGTVGRIEGKKLEIALE